MIKLNDMLIDQITFKSKVIVYGHVVGECRNGLFCPSIVEDCRQMWLLKPSGVEQCT